MISYKPHGDQASGIENIRSAWAGKFAAMTGGKGTISDVASSLTLSIASRANGSTITGDHVTVTGAIINTSGNETGVTVNGIVVPVYGTTFVANHATLAEGTNIIEGGE